MTYHRPSNCMRSPEGIDREYLLLSSFRHSIDTLERSPHKFWAKSTLALNVFDFILFACLSAYAVLTNQLGTRDSGRMPRRF